MRQPRHRLALTSLLALIAFPFGVAPSGEGTPVRARFEREVEWPWGIAPTVPGESPWAPRGDRLAVVRGGVLAILEISKPQAPPRELFSMPDPVRSMAWSPDGKWIACLTRLRTESLVWVIRVEDGVRHVAGAGDVWPFLWLSDHVLVGYRHEDGEEILRFVVPGSEAHAHTFDPLPRLILIGQRKAEMALARLTPGAEPEVSLLRGLGRALLRTTFPDRRRFLVCQLDRDARSVVVDASGLVLFDLGSRIDAECATGDGRFVAGVHEEGDGHAVFSSEVLLYDLFSNRAIRVEDAPHSMRVECAPRGNWVALQTLRGGLVIGRLAIDGTKSRPAGR
jgi:hypothetical protein